MYTMKTKNKSFLKMHNYLKNKGIKNNKFFLKLYDESLENIDPHSPNLSQNTKAAIFAECRKNYWYFLREVVRIPHPKDALKTIPYELNSITLALNYGFENNVNMFAEQSEKLTDYQIISRYLWLYFIGVTNYNMHFIDKLSNYAKLSLKRIRVLICNLPSYFYSNTCDLLGDRAKTLKNEATDNKIMICSYIRNKTIAENMGRGVTSPIIWYNNYSFIPFNNTVFESMYPIFKNILNRYTKYEPHGILITTGFDSYTTKGEINALRIRNNSFLFTDLLYDATKEQIDNILKNNMNSFINIK